MLAWAAVAVMGLSGQVRFFCEDETRIGLKGRASLKRGTVKLETVESNELEIECPLCGHKKAHKHGKTSKGSQRYFCNNCHQTFTDTFDPIHYRRRVSPETVRIVL